MSTAERRGPVLGAARLAAGANGELVSALDGNWGEIVVKTQGALTKKAAAEGAPAADTGRCAAGDARFDPRHHDDPRLPHARASACRSRSAEAEGRRAGARARSQDLRLHRGRLRPQDLHRQRSSGSNSRPSRRCWRSCSAPIARPSASSSCTSPIPRPSSGSRSAWKGPDKEIKFTAEGKKAILNKLIEAEGFEKFLDVKYTGTKRFGLDGSESLIPALEQIIKRGGALGVKDIVLGMAHRGRLNVLTQVMMKPHRALFHEFKGGAYLPRGRRRLGRREVPSRCLVGPRVRRQPGASVADRQSQPSRDRRSGGAGQGARQAGPARRGRWHASSSRPRQTDRSVVMPLLIHGDAAFAGQGVIAECLGLSGLKGHRTGGSIHFVINNQIGFTTSPMYSRSSPYPTDVAKMIEAPVFHVNGDDPEAVVYVSKVATEFRQRFGRPVVIDMFCYRRFGHNEGDEPSFTQPLMYSQDPRPQDDARDSIPSGWWARACSPPKRSTSSRPTGAPSSRPSSRPGRISGPTRPTGSTASGRTCKRADADGPRRGDTGAEIDELVTDRHGADARCRRASTSTRRSSASSTTAWRRSKAARASTGRPAKRWRSARCSPKAIRCGSRGQDVERGTFTQRHSVLNDQDTDETYTPLNNVADQTSSATRSSTRCSRKRRCSGSSTAIRWPSPTR